MNFELNEIYKNKDYWRKKNLSVSLDSGPFYLLRYMTIRDRPRDFCYTRGSRYPRYLFFVIFIDYIQVINK